MQKILCTVILAFWLPLAKHSENPEDVQTIRSTPGQFTALVSILDAKNRSHICSGMIVDLRHVIITASCVAAKNPFNLVVSAGSGEMAEKIPVKLIVTHPDYRKDSYEYNLAVLRLMKRLIKNTFVHPAVIAKKKPGVGETCFIAGWSQNKGNNPSSMFYSKVKIMKIELCRKCAENTLCAGNFYHEGGCIDDVGSPIMCNGALHGIFIGSAKGCQTSSGLYTDIIYYEDWIRRLTKWSGFGHWPLPHPATRKMKLVGYSAKVFSNEGAVESVNFFLFIYIVLRLYLWHL